MGLMSAPVDTDLRDCPFCKRIAAREFDRAYGHDAASGAVVFEPLNPVTPGHLLVVPMSHVEDVAQSPWVSSQAMFAAAIEASKHEAVNVITSRGAVATQTVRHLHIHIVPRREGDGLHLPWTDRGRAARGAA